MNIDIKYADWIEKIANQRKLEDLTNHFREHVCEHYNYYDRKSSKLSMDTWMTGVLNFMSIFEKKLYDITIDDRLFKLCTYYKSHPLDGPAPSFNVEDFMQKYDKGITQPGIEEKYGDWVGKIADFKDLGNLINHFREHVCNHYGRHKDKGTKQSMNIWFAESLNFMSFFEKKLSHINPEDKLFKLCMHYINHDKVEPHPDFDVFQFIEKYNGSIKALEIK